MAKVVSDECHRIDIPIVMSVTQHATVAACKRARFLENVGADCLMILPPFFLKPSGEEIYKHTKAIADAVKIPVLAQYAPEQTGVTISPDIWKKLSEECENAKYFKIECKPSGAYISRLMETIANPKIFIGNCGFQMIEAFDRGAVGVMPSCCITEIYMRIYREYFSGNKDEAVRYHNAFLPLYNHIHQNVEMNVYYEKKILKLRGIIENDTGRSPAFTSDPYTDKLFLYYFDQMKSFLV
jgi:4-hydroxy-tetrahydrodipicolinate synthase